MADLEDLLPAAMHTLERLKSEMRKVASKALYGRTSSVMGGRGTGGLLQDSYHAEAIAWLDSLRFELDVLRQEAP